MISKYRRSSSRDGDDGFVGESGQILQPSLAAMYIRFKWANEEGSENEATETTFRTILQAVNDFYETKVKDFVLIDQYHNFMSEAPNMHCDLVFTTVTEWVQIMGLTHCHRPAELVLAMLGTQDQMVARAALGAKRITHVR